MPEVSSKIASGDFTQAGVEYNMSLNETTMKEILPLIQGLKFGEVIIKVQDSHIVSVEKREKIRLKSADPILVREAKVNSESRTG